MKEFTPPVDCLYKNCSACVFIHSKLFNPWIKIIGLSIPAELHHKRAFY